VKRALRNNTKLITIMMANNETALCSREEIGRVAREADCLFPYRRGQAAGKFQSDVRRSAATCFYLRTPRMHAPQGIGALYVRKGI